MPMLNAWMPICAPVQNIKELKYSFFKKKDFQCAIFFVGYYNMDCIQHSTKVNVLSVQVFFLVWWNFSPSTSPVSPKFVLGRFFQPPIFQSRILGCEGCEWEEERGKSSCTSTHSCAGSKNELNAQHPPRAPEITYKLKLASTLIKDIFVYEGFLWNVLIVLLFTEFVFFFLILNCFLYTTSVTLGYEVAYESANKYEK